MQPNWSNQIIPIYSIGQFKPVKWYDIISLVKWYHITSRVSFLFTALSHWYSHIICNKKHYRIIFYQRSTCFKDPTSLKGWICRIFTAWRVLFCFFFLGVRFGEFRFGVVGFRNFKPIFHTQRGNLTSGNLLDYSI